MEKFAFHFNDLTIGESNCEVIRNLFIKSLKWSKYTEIWVHNIILKPNFFKSEAWRKEVEEVFLEEGIAFDVSVIMASEIAENSIKDVFFTNSAKGNELVLKNTVMNQRVITV